MKTWEKLGLIMAAHDIPGDYDASDSPDTAILGIVDRFADLGPDERETVRATLGAWINERDRLADALRVAHGWMHDNCPDDCEAFIVVGKAVATLV